MATGSGSPRTVRADRVPMSEVSGGAAAASTGGTFAEEPLPGAGAAVAVAVGVGVLGAAPKSTVATAVNALPLAVPRSWTSLFPETPCGCADHDTWLPSALAAEEKAPATPALFSTAVTDPCPAAARYPSARLSV